MVSRNPATLVTNGEYPKLTSKQVQDKLTVAKTAYDTWRFSSFQDRAVCMGRLALHLRERRDVYAGLITQEMGCPISQARTEIEKCAYIAEQFAQDAEEFLGRTNVEIGAKDSYISYEPLGVVLHVAPWNYPFYLALRPAIPAIMAGNVVLLKHASNVPQVSLALQAIFEEAGFPKGVFQSLLVSANQVPAIVEDDRVAMITLIGSEVAGSQVAMQAGKNLKKTVMELGGSDPFIVLEDADLDLAVEAAVVSRLRNCGQSCNAAKRFVVVQSVAQEFTYKLQQAFEREILGDPLEPKVTMGPLATLAGLEDLERQVEMSIAQGAKLVMGGRRPDLDLPGYFYTPTILTRVTSSMPVYTQEVFGPVAAVIEVTGWEDALRVANDNRLGLGASLWTRDYDRAYEMIPRIEAGNVYVNSIVRGDPRLPYGGIKKSGYGREFGEVGIKEFVNVKTVVVK